MDYTKFYELEREPFRNDPDERFYFESSSHRRAHLRLIRAVHQRKGLSVLIGNAGCGKTTLAHHLFGLLEPEQFAARSLSIGHSECAEGWLLPHVATAFGVSKPAKRAADQLEQIQDQLAQLVEESTMPVLLVDEAQMLRTKGVMEEFRGLLNLMHEDRKVISIVLFGLADLGEVLRLDEPLAQRVEVRFELTHLTKDETAEYVRHRLAVAGNGDAIFSDEAMDAIWTYAHGVPRIINTLCDNTLFEGFLNQAQPVDGSLVVEAAEQLGLGEDAVAAGETPDWMETVVPPAETDFERAVALETAAPQPEPELDDEPEDDEDAELELAMGETQVGVSFEVDEPEEDLLGDDDDEEEDAVMLKSESNKKKPKLEAGDFSMGSIVRDMEADEDDPDGESLIESAADALAELDDDLDLDNEISQVIGESTDGELDLELGVDDDDDDEELALELEAEEDDADCEIQLKSESQSAIAGAADDDSGEFDPSLLLAEDDEDEDDEPAPATVVVPVVEAAKAAAETRTDEPAEDDDLDSLFEDIQVTD